MIFNLQDPKLLEKILDGLQKPVWVTPVEENKD